MPRSVAGRGTGPADLAADMGSLGNPGAPQMRAEVKKAFLKIQSHGKAAGILIGALALPRHYVEFAATVPSATTWPCSQMTAA
ncbi:pyruvate/phosphoenolpyruvate kinase family protein [Rhizobium gallicum]|uniref:Pyruvate/phosphoenolpyruvate kinase family protein n=1 Tax=Rhizobium gallicum TaxID=56730 RepID=A0A1L5NM22_9HYPH|nr:aldolase/citrate lyase family protein [Rhizobium gallicum]APO68943.1 pyruvate/phosphoenolpyruvate kinase family protein [Rhizobium gallicum]